MAMSLSAMQVPKMGRTMRRPQHRFQLKVRPWQIQPFMIAPVLPGETMKNLLLQARVVSDPIKNPLIGWWSEYYFFYVKHRDLYERDAFMDMFIDPSKDMSALKSTADVQTYHAGGSINYTRKCLYRVVDCYFRNDGETYLAGQIDTLPVAGINQSNWMDSIIKNADYYRPDVDVDANDDNTITASEVDQALQSWNWMRSAGLTEQSYEDFLQTYGVRVPAPLREEKHWPELVRYLREWTYPTNTVDPTTGLPSTALSWSIAERADKDRFFKEPGFLFGVQVVRPKVYFAKQLGSATHFLDDVYSWLPAVMRGDPTSSMKEFAALSGPVPTSTGGYWFDVRDLFLYGDQYVNFATSATDGGFVQLPAADLQHRFATAADADALFKDAQKNHIRTDGVVSLAIASTTRDMTATTN